MLDKERLEEIEKNLNFLINDDYGEISIADIEWLIKQVDFLNKLLESEAIYNALRAEYKNPSMIGEKWQEFFRLFQEFQEKRELRSDKQ